MRYTQETIILGRNVTWGEMLQGKMLHWEKCYIGENVTGENVTGEFVTGENVLGENVIHPIKMALRISFNGKMIDLPKIDPKC